LLTIAAPWVMQAHHRLSGGTDCTPPFVPVGNIHGFTVAGVFTSMVANQLCKPPLWVSSCVHPTLQKLEYWPTAFTPSPVAMRS
jgi:hypothetical protein